MSSAPNTVDRVKCVVADEYGITVGDLLTSAKRHAAAHPRQLAIWLCRECVAGAFGHPFSLKVLARLFRRKDHSTAWHALYTVQGRIAASSKFADHVQLLRYRIASEAFCVRSLNDAAGRFPALAADPAKPRTSPIFVIRGMNSTANRGALGGRLLQPVAPRPVATSQGVNLFSGAAQ